MTRKKSEQDALGRVTAAALLSVSCVALGLLAAPGRTHAQSSSTQLPPVSVSPPEEQKRRVTGTSTTPRANRSAARRTQVARRPQAEPAAPVPFTQSFDARTGTVGVYSNSTSVATKTNTPLINIPQSVDVLTKELHPGPELPDPHRRHPLCSGRRHPSGRRQPRRTRHPRRRFERELLRQRLPRRRPVLPRPLQRAEHRDPERSERADLRPRRRRRPRQPHTEGGRLEHASAR